MNPPTLKVMLVGDDPAFARVLRQSLAAFTSSRIELGVSEGLEEALHRLHPERWDAVLLDLDLRDSEGLAAFRRIQTMAPALPILILAGFENETLALNAVREGAQDYLVKARFDGRFLSRVIRHAIERKRTQEALRESEQRYRRLLGSTTDYIYTVKVDNGASRPAAHGPACVTVTGYTAEEYASDASLWYRMIHEEDRAKVTEQVTRLLRGQAVRPLEHRIFHKDGSLRWIRNTPVSHKDAHGRVIAYDGLISDITERKEAEQRLGIQCGVTRVLAEAATLAEAAGRVLRVAGDNLGWDVGALWVAQPRSGLLACVVTWRKPAEVFEAFEAALGESSFAAGDGLFGEIWSSGRPAWVQDPSAERACFPQARLAERAGVRTACGIPVSIDGRVLGVIGWFGARAQPADDAVVQLLSTVGEQVGQFMLRKQAEEVLAEERNLLRTLVDTLPDAIYVKDAESRFVLGNRAVARLMGAQTPQELQGRTDAEFYPADLARRYREDERQVVGSGEPLINREEPVIDASGQPGWLLTTKAPLRDLQGRIVGLVGIGRDITERKRAEEALRRTQDRFALAVQATQDGIWDWNVTNGEVYFSPRWKAMLGYEERELEGAFSSWEDLLHPEERERARAHVEAYLAGRVPIYELEHRLRHKDGSYRWILARGKVVDRDAEGRPTRMTGTHLDITERKEAERQLLQANLELVEANLQLSRSEEALRRALSELQASHEQLKSTQLQLIEAEKHESIGTLAAGVAHEVKNPLQTILMGIAYLSRGRPVKNGTAAAVLEEMREAVRRADSIVRGLVEFSSGNHPEVQEEALNGIVDQSLGLLRYELTRQHVTVVRELAPDLPRVKLERNKIQQAFINLFLNAVQAMPNGGTLTVRTYAPPDASPRTEPATDPRRSPGAVVVEVEDSGKGIPQEVLPRIFDPFFTTKAPGVGTGLGLPVTRKIIELHGGSIDATNRPGGGARFAITFHPEPRRSHEQETHPDR